MPADSRRRVRSMRTLNRAASEALAAPAAGRGARLHRRHGVRPDGTGSEMADGEQRPCSDEAAQVPVLKER